MKIDLNSIDRENFLVQERFLKSGERVWLVNPNHVGAKWNKDNLIYRSSVWNEQGEPVNLGFKKFGNWAENPELWPPPTSLDDAEIVSKLDGSLLCVSKYKGELIARTRGTIDAYGMENGHEIDTFKQKYPKAFGGILDKEDITLLFEWTSPLNKIVIDYGSEADISLIGAVRHTDYSLILQNQLDDIAAFIGVKRPKRYSFKTIPEMISTIEAIKGEEGVCVYYGNGQFIKKLKGLDYLCKHKFKENANLGTVFELFCSYGYPTLEEFQIKLTQQFDYECAESVKEFSKQVICAYEQVKLIKAEILEFVNPLKSLPRKEAAQSIIKQFGGRNLSSFAFMALDGKEVDIKKLLGLTLGLR